ncbi:Multidrug resistance protein MdtH [Streptomyces sp. RB5]|uniref:Multidrug resistance protein MdtH n=1 Tax=Streptomyces smaragdinus TaxID=2585196 RepID=A0A7K0CIQ0_9ACTN|nr:MFS transporter [Streptomyces smaragdinus]MQY13365.1 Multidrug resistance protein MdtH [Streptomyces smaragdinus]
MPRTVWLLVAARTVNQLGTFSISFLTVLVSTRFGVGPAVAGLVSAAFGLATIPSRLVGGRLADSLGPRRTIALGLGASAVAQLGLAAADSLTAALCWAVVLGLVFELYEPPSQALIADAVSPGLRVRAYGLLNAALAAGGVGAGLLAAGLGRWDLRWLFVADAATCLLCGAALYAVLPADRPRAEDTASRPDARPWRDRRLLLLLAFGTAFALIYLQVLTVLPLALGERGREPADAGLLFTASAVALIAAQPLLRLPRVAALSAPAALTAGHVLMAAALAGYATPAPLPVLLTSAALWGVGQLLVMGRAFALVADLAPPGATGRYLAVYGTSWGIAGIAAPVTGTQLLEHAGPGPLWTVTAALCLVLAAGQRLLKSAPARPAPAAEAPPPHSAALSRGTTPGPPAELNDPAPAKEAPPPHSGTAPQPHPHRPPARPTG